MSKKPQTPKAPYIPKGWLENFFQQIKRVRLSEVNNGIVKQYELTAPGNESKLVSALRFLKLIDDSGKLEDEKITNLKMEGEKYHTALDSILHQAYAEVFQTLDIEKATASDLRNFFIGRYAFSQGQATSAATLFAFLCEKAKVRTSDDIASLNRKSVRSNTEKPRKKIESPQKRGALFPNEAPTINEIPSSDAEYVVIVRGNGFTFNKTLKSKADLDLFVQTVKLNCQFKE